MLLFLCFGLAACDAGEDLSGENPPPATIDPDVVIGGSAYADVTDFTDAGDPAELFLYHFTDAVGLSDTEFYNGGLFVAAIESQSGQTPVAAQTYTDSGPLPLIVLYADDVDIEAGETLGFLYRPAAGSITVTAVSGTEVRGTYAFDLVPPDGFGAVSVGGDFVAPIVEQVDLVPPEPQGSFSATATGAVTMTLAGVADFFSLDPPGGRTTLDLSADDSSADPDTTLFVSGIVDAVLAAGPYPITSGIQPTGEFGAGFEIGNVAVADDFFRLSDATGTFTVATITETEASGSFTFTGRTLDADLSDLGETTATGTFSAPRDE